MGDRRTRFSIFYFLLAFLILLGINYLLGQQDTARISYSEMKQRIAAGQIEEVSVGEEILRATVVDSLRRPGTPMMLTAVRVPEDEALVPLLEANGVEYEGTTQGWFSQALGWLLPLGLLVLFWVWMLRRINPAQGVMTVGKNRARIVGEEGTGVTFADVAGADEAKE
ncbi:MAG TPA: ATP-dependent metallopeptidase FtsH/Yme1/Tma family protein, partial [Longimicrobiales bacterium]